MTKRVYIFVNGILTFPGDAKAWTDRAVTWVHKHTDHKAEKYEYFVAPLTRRFTLDKHARNLANLVQEYQLAGYNVVLVGHSNGCEIIRRAIKQSPVSEVHLIAGATDNDLSDVADRAGRVFVYWSKGDKVLGYFARPSTWLVGWAGLGYGYLGFTGPKHDLINLVAYEYTAYGHSDYFNSENFPEVMDLIANQDL